MNRKIEDSNFYMYIMVTEMGIVMLSAFIVECVYFLLNNILGKIHCEVTITFDLRSVLFILLSIWFMVLITKRKWIRKRILGDKLGKGIILCSMVCINVACFLGIAYKDKGILIYICLGLYLILEVIGLLYFDGRYIRYDYSSVRILSNDGREIGCGDIENITIKNRYVMIKGADKCVTMQYHDIGNVEFYGPPKYILLESNFNKIKKRWGVKKKQIRWRQDI